VDLASHEQQRLRAELGIAIGLVSDDHDGASAPGPPLQTRECPNAARAAAAPARRAASRDVRRDETSSIPRRDG
jgi:hypothetical protein